jgi:hypothetical protein
MCIYIFLVYFVDIGFVEVRLNLEDTFDRHIFAEETES